MPEKAPEQEPSIEEILASIRQIISDDEGDSAPAAPAPEPDPEPASPAGDDVFELTDRIGDADEPPIQIALRDAEPDPEPELAPAPIFRPEPPRAAPPPPPPPPPEPDGESIFTQSAAAATMHGFSRLTNNILVERPSHPSGITLEDIARDMLRPMLREWLDSNLPPLIEKLVQKELEKLARQARDE